MLRCPVVCLSRKRCPRASSRARSSMVVEPGLVAVSLVESVAAPSSLVESVVVVTTLVDPTALVDSSAALILLLEMTYISDWKINRTIYLGNLLCYYIYRRYRIM